MNPKFKIGQKVQVKADGEIGEVLSFSFDPENGFRYVLSSKEVDLEKKEIINGFKTCLEGELKSTKQK